MPRAAKAAQERAARVDALRAPLSETFGKLGLMTLPIVPVTATVCVERGPMYADHLCTLAAADERVLKMLEHVMTASAIGDVIFMGATLGVALAVDRRLVRPNSFPAQALVHNEIERVMALEREWAAQNPRPIAPDGVEVAAVA